MKLPLSRSLLNDPAFSTDPRAHPHYASAYKSVPPTPAPPRIPRRTKLKTLVRRLTARHNLDRIDELDETDPFGTSHHHHGPYEAIATNLGPSKRQSDPLPLRPSQLHSASRSPLSLHLEPGQILQQNSIYSSYASRITRLQSPLEPFPNPRPVLSPNLSRSHPPAPEHRSSPDLSHTFQNQPSPSLRAHQERYSGNQPYHTSDTLAHHRNRDTTPNTPYRIEKTITPPRYESKSYSSNHLQSPQPPSIISQNAQTQLPDNQVSPLPPRDSAPQSLYSLDVSCTLNGSVTSTKSLEPPRMRHLPKRLVMPTPLQPQPNILPPVAALQEHRHPLQGARFEEKPATYTQKPRLLRKKSSTLHAKTPIPDVSQNDTPPIRASSPSKMMTEDKERTRRRLSKRKVDI